MSTRLSSPAWRLAAGTVTLLAVRLLLTIPRSGPVVVADEVGYLTNARVLAGGTPGQMTEAPFYHGGYSLLLAPLLAAGAGPTTTYRAILALNAVLAASVAPLLYLLLTRCFDVSRRTAVWAALAAAAYPSITVYSQAAWSENLLVPLLVVWLLAAGAFVRASRVAWSVAAALAATWLWATHGRMLVVVALTALVFVALAVARAPARAPAVVGLALLVAGVYAVHVLDHFLVDRSWGGHAPGEVDQRLSTLESVSGIGELVRNIVGQSWYLAVSTLGVLTVLVARPPRRALTVPSAVLSLAVLTAAGLLVESSLSFPTIDRPDMLVYGRYTDVAVPPLLALGLARFRLIGRGRVATWVAVLGIWTVVVVLLRTGVHPPGFPNRWNVASLPAPTFGLGPKILLAAGVVAAAAFVLLAAVSHRLGLAVAPLALLLFLPTTAVVEHSPVLTAQSAFYPAGWTTPAPAVGDARAVAFDTDGGGSVYVYQWFVPRARFVLFAGAVRPPEDVVFASPAWARRHRSLAPRLLWSDRSRNGALYRIGRG